MALRHKIIGAALAVGALVASTAAASAAPAYATSNVNVRSGPGTGYAIVDALRRGQQVDIQYCQGSWCFVEKPGPDGWVSANYLDRRGVSPRPPSWDPRPPRPPHWNPRPRPPHWNPGWNRPPNWHNPRPGGSFCYNGPNGYFCIGR